MPQLVMEVQNARDRVDRPPRTVIDPAHALRVLVLEDVLGVVAQGFDEVAAVDVAADWRGSLVDANWRQYDGVRSIRCRWHWASTMPNGVSTMI